MKSLLILCITCFIVIACHESVPVKPSDCHPSGQIAIIKDDSPPPANQPPWWETHHVECPDNMRMLKPSQRETDLAIGEYANMNDTLKWEWEHTTCVPDGIDNVH